MENFLKDKDIWIVGSVCLVASFLWQQIWNLFTYKRKRGRETPSPDIQVLVVYCLIRFIHTTELSQSVLCWLVYASTIVAGGPCKNQIV